MTSKSRINSSLMKAGTAKTKGSFGKFTTMAASVLYIT